MNLRQAILTPSRSLPGSASALGLGSARALACSGWRPRQPQKNARLQQPSTNYKPRALAAFTLIELLIALAISAIVLVVINAAFFGALRMRNRVSAIAAQTLPIDIAVSTMKRDLLCIVPPGVLAGPMGSDAVNTALTQPLLLEIFTTSASIGPDAPWGDLQKIDYWLQDPATRSLGGGRDLIRGVTHNLLATTQIPPEPQSLLQDVKNLKFSYYDGTNWLDTWSTTLSNTPAAIKVSIDFMPPTASEQLRAPVQFLVPLVVMSSTNISVTNLMNN